jgi:hypothetical protein
LIDSPAFVGAVASGSADEWVTPSVWFDDRFERAFYFARAHYLGASSRVAGAETLSQAETLVGCRRR